jgi:hypothetical protein|tara:strand:+ start:32 stop:427 length:396 start_codon:yes stop_codon:yes gene_type:complete
MKYLSKHQSGMTFLGVLMILAMLGCFFLFGLRAFPIYTEFFAMKQSMKAVANQPLSKRPNTLLTRRLLLRNLELNSVYKYNEKNIKDIAKVKKKKGKRYLLVNYDASNRLFGNLYLSLKIDESIELPGGKK